MYTERFSDYVIKCPDGEVKCHRLVLYQTSGMFHDLLKSCDSSYVHLDFPVATVKACVKSMYSPTHTFKVGGAGTSAFDVIRFFDFVNFIPGLDFDDLTDDSFDELFLEFEASRTGIVEHLLERISTLRKRGLDIVMRKSLPWVASVLYKRKWGNLFYSDSFELLKRYGGAMVGTPDIDYTIGTWTGIEPECKLIIDLAHAQREDVHDLFEIRCHDRVLIGSTISDERFCGAIYYRDRDPCRHRNPDRVLMRLAYPGEFEVPKGSGMHIERGNMWMLSLPNYQWTRADRPYVPSASTVRCSPKGEFCLQHKDDVQSLADSFPAIVDGAE